MKVAVILGTRPEAIKLAPVIRSLEQHPSVDVEVCDTGQHREMLAPILSLFRIVPSYRLEVMTPGQTLNALTAQLMSKLDLCLRDCKPDLVLIQGDTTTALCGALAAFHNQIPVGHVEAGLRTGDMQAPWPEEANRVLISRLAQLHFAPTDTSRRHLLAEGIPTERIFVTGNPVIDALFLAKDMISCNAPSIPGLASGIMEEQCPLVLITGHRRESFGEGMKSICRAIARLSARFPEAHFVYPVHLNPNVRESVELILGVPGSSNHPNVHLIEPLSYLPFVALLLRSTLILTDSGGIQEEGPSLGKPVLVMREKTERPEAIDAGTVKLVGTEEDVIFHAVSRLLEDEGVYQAMAQATNPYGDGHAASRILEACLAL